ARRYVEQGRRLLAELGAWPWCLAEGGFIPDRWHTQRTYARALADWHYQQSLTVLVATFASVGWAAGSDDKYGGHAAIDAAKAAYREMYEAVREASEPS